MNARLDPDERWPVWRTWSGPEEYILLDCGKRVIVRPGDRLLLQSMDGRGRWRLIDHRPKALN